MMNPKCWCGADVVPETDACFIHSREYMEMMNSNWNSNIFSPWAIEQWRAEAETNRQAYLKAMNEIDNLKAEISKLRDRVMVCPSCGHQTHFKYPEPPSARDIRLAKFINHVMAHHNLPDICCPDIEEKLNETK